MMQLNGKCWYYSKLPIGKQGKKYNILGVKLKNKIKNDFI